MSGASLTGKRLHVSTGSRLHFGLFALANPAGSSPERFSEGNTSRLSYGGMGMMLQHPQTTLVFSSAEQFQVIGDTSGRVAGFAERWLQHQLGLPGREANFVSRILSLQSLPVAIDVQTQANQHNGLGAGTQLALAIARGLYRFFSLGDPDPATLANSVGRGLRSAVGTYGFQRGGWLVDRGKTHEQALGILDGAFPFPPSWRVLLLTRTGFRGTVSGAKEKQAFARLPDIPLEITEKLVNLSREVIVPALLAQNYSEFAPALYEYGFTAGQCFAEIQGGPFASRALEERVNQFRDLGLPAVGQSSWGPTLFAIAPDLQTAIRIQQDMERRLDPQTESLTIVEGRNSGAECYWEALAD